MGESAIADGPRFLQEVERQFTLEAPPRHLTLPGAFKQAGLGIVLTH